MNTIDKILFSTEIPNSTSTFEVPVIDAKELAKVKKLLHKKTGKKSNNRLNV